MQPPRLVRSAGWLVAAALAFAALLGALFALTDEGVPPRHLQTEPTGRKVKIPEASLEVSLPPDVDICGRVEVEPSTVQYFGCNSQNNGKRDLLIEVYSKRLLPALGFNGDLRDFRDQYVALHYPSSPEPISNWGMHRSDIVTVDNHEALRIEAQRLGLLVQELWIVLRNGQLLHFAKHAGIDDPPAAAAVFSAMIDSAVLRD